MSIGKEAVRIALSGRIDSSNAAEVKTHIQNQLSDQGIVPVVLDAEELEYISSAGLRVLLQLKKTYSDVTIANVNSEIYEILEMTGFTEFMTVQKAYRVVSVEGCEEIGRGANGTVYRIDDDTVVKAYNNADALADIQHEREVARLALVLGIPTAISYDVVRVGDSYGSVFELLNARSFSNILAHEPEKMDWCVKEYIEMLEKIHSTLVPKGKLPDMRETAIGWAEFVREYLPEELGDKLVALVKAVPQDDHMIHGDYHTKNLELTGEEVLLIDMDTLAVGHPIFEWASIFNAYLGYSELDPEVFRKFQGFDPEAGRLFFRKALAAYLQTEVEEKILEVRNKAAVIGYTRMIRRSIRRKLHETEQGHREVELWTKQLILLLEHTDTLLFSRNELEIEAVIENLGAVQSFIDERLEPTDCSLRGRMQISLAAEEIFSNIANYAYSPNRGIARVKVEVSEEPVVVTITFMDHGIPYDPLEKKDPDVSLPASERAIGGLGIFLTKKTMDEVAYEYRDGQNILTLKKNL